MSTLSPFCVNVTVPATVLPAVGLSVAVAVCAKAVIAERQAAMNSPGKKTAHKRLIASPRYTAAVRAANIRTNCLALRAIISERWNVAKRGLSPGGETHSSGRPVAPRVVSGKSMEKGSFSRIKLVDATLQYLTPRPGSDQTLLSSHASHSK